MSRVTKVSASGVSGSLGQYAYAGSSRRVSATIGAALLALDFFSGSAAGYPGLDRFGRVIDQHYVRASGAGAGQTVHRYQYGYDLSGNRTFARVTQVPVDSVPQENTRSYAYGYDDLQRLRAADLGALDTSNQSVPSPTRAVDWWLDNLGNWSGAPDPDGDPQVGDSAPGVTIVEQPPGGGAPVTTTLHHQTAIDNALTGILRDDGAGGSAAAPTIAIQSAASMRS